MDHSVTSARAERAIDEAICNVCGGRGEVVLRIDGLPTSSNVPCETPEAAREATKGTLALASCSACGHLFNSAFDPELVCYSDAYENSLHYSPRFRAYARELAASLVERHALHGKSLVEIGCGKGDFLRLLCAISGGHGLGFDSSYEAGRISDDSERITVRKDLFTASVRELGADFVCARHVLEHVGAPAELLVPLRRALGRSRIPIYVEVPDATYMLREVAVWDLVYEHPSYFSAASLRRALEDASFEHVASSVGYDGQFLQMDAVTGEGHGARDEPPAELAELAARFARAFERRIARWSDRLARRRVRGQSVAVWGAGSKGVTFVNVTERGEEVDCLVDVNPHKQGLFVPGTGHPIVSPKALADRRPDLVVVMNPVYEREVARSVRELGLGAEVLLA